MRGILLVLCWVSCTSRGRRGEVDQLEERVFCVWNTVFGSIFIVYENFVCRSSPLCSCSCLYYKVLVNTWYFGLDRIHVGCLIYVMHRLILARCLALMQFRFTTVYPVCSDDVLVRWGAWFAWHVVASPLSPYFNLQRFFQRNLGWRVGYVSVLYIKGMATGHKLRLAYVWWRQGTWWTGQWHARRKEMRTCIPKQSRCSLSSGCRRWGRP
jgi:hypothetical protein